MNTSFKQIQNEYLASGEKEYEPVLIHFVKFKNSIFFHDFNN